MVRTWWPGRWRPSATPRLVAVTTNVSIIDDTATRCWRAERRNGGRDLPRGVYIHAWNTRHLWLPFPRS